MFSVILAFSPTKKKNHCHYCSRTPGQGGEVFGPGSNSKLVLSPHVLLD